MNQQQMTNALMALQNRVEQSTTLQMDLQGQLNQIKLTDHQKKLRRGPIWDLVIASITALWVGSFVSGNIRELLGMPLAAIPAALMMVFAIVQMHVSIRHLIVASEIDLAKPIVETQRNLATLRKLRVKATQWVFICSMPGWIVFPLFFGQWLFGVKFIYVLKAFGANPAWGIANIALMVAMMPVLYWLFRKSKYAKRLEDSIAGEQILEAEAFLSEIEAFQKDH